MVGPQWSRAYLPGAFAALLSYTLPSYLLVKLNDLLAVLWSFFALLIIVEWTFHYENMSYFSKKLTKMFVDIGEP